jgi:lycopene beta-cyclase
MSAPIETDVLIAGGGLAGGLCALALAARRPDLAVTVVDAGESLGGNHIWSFFDSDIAPGMRWLVDPLVSRRWSGHDVRFPTLERTLTGGYNSIESERLDTALRANLAGQAIVQGSVATLSHLGAQLADGRTIAAPAVIDARGAGNMAALELGWQKFVGQMLRLSRPHGLNRPVIMDATVDQTDGYRFIYLLPFDETRLFVEDTYYTVGAELDVAVLRHRIDAYVAKQGWHVEAVDREEAAALPIATGGDFDAFWPAADPIPRAGMAAGLFQPMTGYSLPDAVRTADLVSSLPHLTSATLATALRGHARSRWRERGFYRLLGRMLFHAAEPPDRYRLLQRFYGLDEGLIARFYASHSTLRDKVRILSGRPPVPLRRALLAATAR